MLSPLFPRRLALSGWLVLGAVLLAAAPAYVGVSYARFPVEDLDEGIPANIYCLRSPHVYTHDVGKVTLQVTNLGIFGNPWIEALSLGWEGG